MNKGLVEQKLIDNDKYQVFLMTCPLHFPLIFLSHNWLVINKKGVLERWETGYRKNIGEENWNYLRKNVLGCSPFDGIHIFPGNKSRWKGEIIGFTSGDEESLARGMIDFIEDSPNSYTYSDKYSFLGPNSNTYPQWVLNHFPEFKVLLPVNAIGKNYR